MLAWLSVVISILTLTLIIMLQGNKLREKTFIILSSQKSKG